MGIYSMLLQFISRLSTSSLQHELTLSSSAAANCRYMLILPGRADGRAPIKNIKDDERRWQAHIVADIIYDRTMYDGMDSSS